jgi:selenide,water dikinase
VQVLKELAPFDHPWVGSEAGFMEDAAILRPDNGAPLVFTVDFITPVVDRAEDFGAIAAANSLSDVYAMGGEPQVALAICGFPEDKLPSDVLRRIFQGGRDKAAEAGCAVVGGHTVLDPELKYGLCVIGSLDSNRVLTQTAARAGDRLVLTKPLGFGIAAQAIKQGRLGEADLARVVEEMSALNRGARDAALAAGARAATDVTGFGLLGHLHNLLLSSRVAARIHTSAVPVFDFVRPLAEQGVVPGGCAKNLAYVEAHTRFSASLDETDRRILADPQTSGGLLISVPADAEAQLIAELEARGTAARSVIGDVIAGEPGTIEVEAGQ